MQVRPAGANKTVNISDVTKGQLARTVNAQGQQIRVLDSQVKTLGKLLLAITLAPEAFAFIDGVVSIDAQAIEKVKAGMTLRLESDAISVKMRVEAPPVNPAEAMAPVGVR